MAEDRLRWQDQLAQLVAMFNEDYPERKVYPRRWCFTNPDKEQVFLQGAAAHGMQFVLVPDPVSRYHTYLLERLQDG